jgi:hypothetical protein
MLDEASATSGADVGQRLPLGALDRVVRRDVDVGGAWRERQLVLPRNPRVLVRFRRAGHCRRPHAPRLLDRLVGPRAGVDVVRCLTGAEQIHRDHRELEARAPLQHQDPVGLGNAGQLAQVGDRGLEQVLEGLRSVTDLHHRHADAWQGDELALRLFEDRQRQHRGTGREIEDAIRRHVTTNHP